MEKVIIPALVAAVISLIGFLVNIYINRKTHESNKKLAEHSAAIRLAETAVNSMNNFNKETEKLRIASWGLIVSVRTITNQKKLPQQSDTDNLNKALKEFQEQLNNFTNSWAEIKGDVPDKSIEMLRALRHGCKNIAHSLEGSILLLIHKMGKTSSSEELSKISDDINNYLDILLKDLDHLFSVVNTIRHHKIEEFLEKSYWANKALHMDR